MKSINTPAEDSNNYVLSKNHPNVLLLVYDGFDPKIAQYFLTNNTLSEFQTNWSKDFTLYNNTISFSGATAGSTRQMFEGYSGTLQFVLQDVFTDESVVKTLFPGVLGSFVGKLKKKNYTVSYKPGSLEAQLPILSASIYKYIPYFLRSTIANIYSFKIHPMFLGRFYMIEYYIIR